MNKTKLVNLTVSIDPEQGDRLTRLAKAAHVSRSALVRLGIEAILSGHAFAVAEGREDLEDLVTRSLRGADHKKTKSHP